jgi:ABC-type branched-subunit amino acid transport system substrate-binding protein
MRDPNLAFERILGWVIFLLFPLAPALSAQTSTETSKPYASMDRHGVVYLGPTRSSPDQLSSGTAVIGMIVPMAGPQQSQGNSLLAAAQLAIEQEQSSGALPDGWRLQLAVRDESGPWGQASTEILNLLDQDHALAVLTSANGATAHLAEQIANKISVPILTLSSDPSTTQANVPWLFRLGPSDADQARAFCAHIYASSASISAGALATRPQKVLLIAQPDHDGRTGAAEFEKAARAAIAHAPDRFEWIGSKENLERLTTMMKTTAPDAIVVWADSQAAESLLPIVRVARPDIPVFLCQKAAQLNLTAHDAKEVFTVAAIDAATLDRQRKFEQLYLARTGAAPGPAARQVCEAIHLIAAALRTTGNDRVLVRDYLANQPVPSHPSAPAFDSAGNDLQQFAIVNLQPR